LSISRAGTIRRSAFATVSLPAAGAPWRKSSFMRDQYREQFVPRELKIMAP
jgi:hypothetical protein